MDNHFFLNAGVHFDQPEIPTWHSLTAMDSDLRFFDSSSISSMASSPVSASNSNQSFLIRELIGKLGNICNSGTGTINRATMDPIPAPNLPSMPEDPTFVERAARFSSFGSRSFNGRNTHLPSKLHRVCSSPSINASETKNSRKRKGKCRDIPCSSPPKVVERGNESNEKRSKLNPEINDRKTEHSLEEEEEEDEEDENEIKKQSSKQKLPEPPKDYIHVRARRGQATDSHSLAERVRREKISERMKLLQDLVPGCNKVTGKALMLEEIINYVQSLQGQVEFLSMKLASVNPRLDFNHPQENAFQAKRCYPSVYENQLQQNGMGPHCSNPMDPINQSHDLHLPTLDGFNNGVPELCEGDLHAIVQMGFAQNTNLMQPQSLQGSNQAPAMKTEF